jgi:hypothetical protein
MGSDDVTLAEIRRHVAMDTNDLYALIVPDAVRAQGFSRGGLVAHGQAIFRERLDQARAAVCPAYQRRKSTISDEVQAAALVATALVGAPVAAGLPFIAMAALMAKIGLGRLCAEDK